MSAGVFELAIDASDYVHCGGDDGGCPALVPIGLGRCPLCGRSTRPDADEPVPAAFAAARLEPTTVDTHVQPWPTASSRSGGAHRRQAKSPGRHRAGRAG